MMQFCQCIFDNFLVNISFSFKYKQYLSFKSAISMQKQEAKLLNKFKKQRQGYLIDCQLLQDQLRIEIRTKEIRDTFYCTYFTNDSFPQQLKFIFVELSQFYIFLQDDKRENFQLENPSKLTLLIPIMSRISRIPVYLSEKKLTKDQMIQQLQIQLKRLRLIQIQYKKLNGGNQRPLEKAQAGLDSAALKNQNQQMRRQIIRLTLQNKKLKDEGAKGQANKIKDIKADMYANNISELQAQNAALKNQQQLLKKQVQQLTNKVNCLKSELNSQDLIIKQLNEQSVNTSNLIKDITGQGNMMRTKSQQQAIPIINPEGQLLIFRPLATSINFRFFEFKNNILSKNNVTTSGQGRLLPSATPVPRQGRYYYKLKMKFSKDPPNIRLGIVGRDLINQAYINSGDEDGLMYYCYSLGKEVIYEGQSKLQGFNLFKNDILFMVVDQDRKQLQWHVQGIHYLTCKYTQSMKTAPNIYMFIQLWTNGDEVQILTS